MQYPSHSELYQLFADQFVNLGAAKLCKQSIAVLRPHLEFAWVKLDLQLDCAINHGIADM